MKQYEVMYFGSDNVVRTKVVEAEDSIAARKTVTKEEGTVVKTRQLNAHRRAIVYKVAMLTCNEEGDFDAICRYEELYGVSSSSKSAYGCCRADVAAKYPDALAYYIYDIADKE